MTWFTLASNISHETPYDITDILPEMASDLAAICNFFFGFFSCNLREDTIDVKLTVHTYRGSIPSRKIETLR